MATVLVQPQALHRQTPPPSPIPSTTPVNRRPSPVIPVIPACPTGPLPTSQPNPDSPDSPFNDLIPWPLDLNEKVRITDATEHPVYAIDGPTLAAVMAHQASRPLPDPTTMFPWLHGLHPSNHLQVGFFKSRKKHHGRHPRRTWRGITVVKLGGDLMKSRIKGAVSPEELLTPYGDQFLNPDPPEGFSVRNFQIQTAKLAPVTDIVVYGESQTLHREAVDLAKRFASAQAQWAGGSESRRYRTPPPCNTYVLMDDFANVAQNHPGLIAIDETGRFTGHVMDFAQWERREMTTMSRASEIAPNVWLGPTPDAFRRTGHLEPSEVGPYDLFIETCELADIPGPRFLAMLDKDIEHGPQRMEFPCSGTLLLPSFNDREVEDIINTVRWIYYLTNPDPESEDITSDAVKPDADTDMLGVGDNRPEDVQMCSDGNVAIQSDHNGEAAITCPSVKPRKILIHCADGYTESSLLALAYYMFVKGVPAHVAWLQLHTTQKRNFFAFQSDVAYLCHIQGRLLHESPASQSLNISEMSDPDWFHGIDGSFPSRILPYLYLGNLNHANNPELLWQLGVRRVLSIGECVNWHQKNNGRFSSKDLMYIDDVQDNGVDPLSQEFERCLKFIEEGRDSGAITFVHCRVGVSRSASICIATVMAHKNLSFARAYCFVRARRLNVIIQPHLRFVYELLQWEEYLMKKRGEPYRRELEWTTIAREIAFLNKPFSKH
ncbi:Dual specificity phosphatase [Penicillium sp. DV-2018c]|nr:Dual specificity phosphatase [Penicillium sp. DV-2018c]KAJ5563538.1 Dual specificity phosphatase [Penicillium sp. DV-2018c]